jgi:cyclophilin family peptidyl-prolyl cis-trans isomerase
VWTYYSLRVQGGDPTGTGSGGESAWGTPFKDEFDSRLQHDKRGIVSMANSGTNSNGSQFFITMKATPHLDLKHGIFAHVVGGMDCLDRIEQLETNAELEKPLTEIRLLKVNVFVNPIKEAEEIFEETVKDAIATRKKVMIPSATRSINEQKQAIAASNLAIKNADMSFLDTLPMGQEGQSNTAPTIGKYLQTKTQEKVSLQKTTKVVGSTSGSSVDDKVAAFLRSQGGGGSVGDTTGRASSERVKEMPSKKKKKVSGGFNNW